MAFHISVVQLNSPAGSIFEVNGVETEEQFISIPSEPFAVGDLKPLIITNFFPGQQKSVSRIKVYRIPAADTHAPEIKNISEPVQRDERYGFLDLDAIKPLERGVLPRVPSTDGGVYRVTDERVRCAFDIKSEISSTECRILPAELLIDSGARSELKLPGRKVVQLGLRQLGQSKKVRGSTNHSAEVINFTSVTVSASFFRNGSEEKVEASLAVRADKAEYVAAKAEYDAICAERVRAQKAAALRTTDENSQRFYTDPPCRKRKRPSLSSSPPPLENIKEIKLSPVQHRPAGRPDEQAVLGIEGMKKLGLHLNSEEQQLEIEEEENMLDPEW
mmetsp:Transcript_23951/g.28971  ORF Transcript_23951/g.28971 Transcript_23951/m.28971 type:complete len:332 (-) Transcript_23951:285-1280(-)|eukprot:CAMPEP_0197849426 /NCGR_PEP_ID=MMETSP1438-20131217/12025_1 /TAXON_ID=1461541 /ORGANISM="Pterosperma sp., Strain CCMP1384" /LENGTH=331 /DNA_ID=CAMNT_0043462109 /DNA_START=214 /DNA_END=1209 /DNA_ORIENTATION=-